MGRRGRGRGQVLAAGRVVMLGVHVWLVGVVGVVTDRPVLVVGVAEHWHHGHMLGTGGRGRGTPEQLGHVVCAERTQNGIHRSIRGQD